jgi:hypothetical protein
VFVLSPFALILLLIGLRDLGGPTPVTPDYNAILGTWINPDGARLVFHSDGSYIASGMPFIADSFTPPGDLLPANGIGTWTIDAWDASISSGGGLSLESRSNGIQLTTTGDPAHPDLYAAIGDPDEGNDFTFTKQD